VRRVGTAEVAAAAIGTDGHHYRNDEMVIESILAKFVQLGNGNQLELRKKRDKSFGDRVSPASPNDEKAAAHVAGG